MTTTIALEPEASWGGLQSKRLIKLWRGKADLDEYNTSQTHAEKLFLVK